MKRLNILIILILLVMMVFGMISLRKISFREEINTKLSSDGLWNHLEQSFTDSSKSKVWPNDLEIIKSDGLKKDAIINSTYKTGSNPRYQYKITEYEKNKSFSYSPLESHPFQGQVTVSVIPTEKGSKLIWEGSYESKSLIASLFFKIYFKRKFFNELENNIRKIENEQGRTA